LKYDLGFLGGGQLARMSIQAAQRMGLRCVSLDPSPVTPASIVADSVEGRLNDPSRVRHIFDISERIALENEFIPAEVIRQAAGSSEALSRFVPSVEALARVQDKLLQREALALAGVPSPIAVALDDSGEKALDQLSFPMVLKARFGGYDGKGTRYAKSLSEFEALRSEWGEGDWLAESFVPFKRELAVMVAMGRTERVCFPTVETVQTRSVCDLVFPARTDASKIAVDAVKAVGGTGLFGVELFELENGTVLVNELAPRPHNSGHYTLDWGGPSQFEYHVRSVMGLSLSQPESCQYAVMANLLGQNLAKNLSAARNASLAHPDAFLHWYEKAEARPGRKMGHLNVVGRDLGKLDSVIQTARAAREDFYRIWAGTDAEGR
jgi:phosphoribosylaminoimidazole carboxylase PurK protein